MSGDVRFRAVVIAGSLLGSVWFIGLGIHGQTTHPPEPHRHAEAQKTKNPVPSTPESIAAGRMVYAKFCRNCHGPAGKGDGVGILEGSPPASNLVDEAWQHGSSDGEIFAIIRDGLPPDLFMDAWLGRISEPNMWNLVNYIRSLGPQQKPPEKPLSHIDGRVPFKY